MAAVQVFDTFAERKPALSHTAVPTPAFAPYPTTLPYTHSHFTAYPPPPGPPLQAYSAQWSDESHQHQPWMTEGQGGGGLARGDGRDLGGPVARATYGGAAQWGHHGMRPMAVEHAQGRPYSPADAWALGGARAPPPPPPEPQTLAHLASYANANFYEDSYRNHLDDAGPSTAFYPPGPSSRARSSTGTAGSENASDEHAAAPRAAPEVAARKTRRPRKPRRRADEEPRDFAHRRYICEVCGPDGAKTFARPSALSLHMLTHSKVKSHICPTCTRAFSISSNLRRHQKLHERDAAAEA